MTAKIERWGIRDGIRWARTVGRTLVTSRNPSTQEFLDAAERAAEIYPNEWVIFYRMGEFYIQIGVYAQSLRACQRCVELRPKDIRSTYALATAYNMLARAGWTDIEWQTAEELSRIHELPEGVFDRQASKTELAELGMAAETAAAQAMRWFERSLQLKPDRESRTQIGEDLSTLYRRFPHLSQ